MYNNITMTSHTVPTVCPLLVAIQRLGFCTFCSATIPCPRLCTVYSAVVEAQLLKHTLYSHYYLPAKPLRPIPSTVPLSVMRTFIP